jgi:hypothetical protein
VGESQIQSESEADAEEEIPEDIGTQQKRTRKKSVVIHKWSYNRLSKYKGQLNVPDIHLAQVRFYTCDRATPIRYALRVSI